MRVPLPQSKRLLGVIVFAIMLVIAFLVTWGVLHLPWITAPAGAFPLIATVVGVVVGALAGRACPGLCYRLLEMRDENTSLQIRPRWPSR
jgi:hypothetical protein